MSEIIEIVWVKVVEIEVCVCKGNSVLWYVVMSLTDVVNIIGDWKIEEFHRDGRVG